MARNRVIYQSEALFVSNDAMSTGVTGHKQLERIQSANYGFNISREDVYCYGKLGKIGSMVLEAPTVSFDTSYLVTDGFNERALGFYVGTGTGDNSSDPVGDDPYIEKSFISGHISELSGKNIYIATVPEGEDATVNITGSEDNDGPSQSVIGIGNAFLTDYTLDLSVGSLPTVSATFEAANIRSTDNVSGMLTPAVTITGGNQARENDEPIVLPSGNTGQSDLVALRPGDIAVKIGDAQGDVMVDIDDGDPSEAVHIQSASLSIPLSRSPLEKLGTKFAYARVVDFPVQATLSVNAIVNEVTSKNLASVIDQTGVHTLDLELKSESSSVAMLYRIKGAELISESFSSSIGSNKSVDLTFTTTIGALNDTENGVFVSGANRSGVYTP